MSILNSDSIQISSVSKYDLDGTYQHSRTAIDAIVSKPDELKKCIVLALKVRVTLQQAGAQSVTVKAAGQQIVFKKGSAGTESGLLDTDMTVKRFSAIIARAAITANKTFLNPMALREGLTDQDGTLYLINVSGFELLFPYFPAEVCAIALLKIKQANNGQVDLDELGKSLATKQYDGKPAIEWIRENEGAIRLKWASIKDRTRTVKSSKIAGNAVLEALKNLL